MTRTMKSLRRGEWIICPADDQPERIVDNVHGVPGRRVVTTTRHRHHGENARRFTITDRPAWAQVVLLHLIGRTERATRCHIPTRMAAGSAS